MKRSVLLIFVLLIACVCLSCGKNDPGKSVGMPETGGTLSETEVHAEADEPVFYPVQYIRTDGYREGVDFPYTVNIGSAEELSEYIRANEERYYLGHVEKVYSDTTIGFADAVLRYDEDFFESNMLIMAVLEEGSGSIRHSLVGITSDDVIHIERITPEVGTCDMAEWHIIIEVPRERAEGHSFTAEYYGEDNRELAVFAHNFVYISARVPKGWGYSVIEYDEGKQDEYQQIGLEFYPLANGSFKVKALYSTRFLGLCGTGLVSERVDVNGYSAVLHRYENESSDWAMYYFDDLAGIYSIEIAGNSYGNDYSAEIAEILDTVELSGKEFVGEAKARELAASECKVEYDSVRSEFDFVRGVWRIHFGKRNTAGGDQTVILYANGKYLESEFGE